MDVSVANMGVSVANMDVSCASSESDTKLENLLLSRKNKDDNRWGLVRKIKISNIKLFVSALLRFLVYSAATSMSPWSTLLIMLRLFTLTGIWN